MIDDGPSVIRGAIPPPGPRPPAIRKRRHAAAADGGHQPGKIVPWTGSPACCS